MHSFRTITSTLKQKIYNQLEAEQQKKSRLSATNWALLFLILLSLVLYTAETEKEIGLREFGALWFLNVALLVSFGLEFVLRLYVVGVNKKYRGWKGLRKYARDNWFMITVDFLAFAPELFVETTGGWPVVCLGLETGGLFGASNRWAKNSSTLGERCIFRILSHRL